MFPYEKKMLIYCFRVPFLPAAWEAHNEGLRVDAKCRGTYERAADDVVERGKTAETEGDRKQKVRSVERQ